MQHKEMLQQCSDIKKEKKENPYMVAAVSNGYQLSISGRGCLTDPFSVSMLLGNWLRIHHKH